MFLAFPLTLDLFKTFKIEMPVLTIWVIEVYRFADNLALPTLVLATAILLRLRQSAGWITAILLCAACDLAGAALILPLLSLMTALKATPLALVTYFGSSMGVWLALVALFLNQILFVLLLRKRREFFAPPGTNGTLLPIK